MLGNKTLQSTNVEHSDCLVSNMNLKMPVLKYLFTLLPKMLIKAVYIELIIKKIHDVSIWHLLLNLTELGPHPRVYLELVSSVKLFARAKRYCKFMQKAGRVTIFDNKFWSHQMFNQLEQYTNLIQNRHCKTSLKI